MAGLLGQMTGASGFADSPYVSADLASFGLNATQAEVDETWRGSNRLDTTRGGYYRIGDGHTWGGTAQKGLSFYDDYYNRIHVNPSPLDLGNLMADQIRKVYVWNAYLVPHVLQAIVTQGANGLVLSGGVLPPATVRALLEIEYDLSVSMTGPPVIDAIIEFQWDTESPQTRITGRRVVILPFKPNCDIDEELAWLTDILSAFGAEQRVALRQAPRQAFSMTWTLNREAFSRMKAQVTGWAHRVYAVPVWTELSKQPTAIGIGDLQVTVDTTDRDYRAGGVIAAIDLRAGIVEAIEIDQVFPGYVTLALPAAVDMPRAYIAPLRFARALEGFTFMRDGSPYTIASGKLSVIDNVDLAQDGVVLHRGDPVLLDCLAVAEPLTERISRPVEVFDNGSGLIETDVINDWVRNMATIAFVRKGIDESWRLRRWLHARRGKQKAFWLPSWNTDAIVVNPIGAGAAAIDIKPMEWAEYYGEKDLMIETKDGARYFTHVYSAQNMGGHERLAIDPIGPLIDPDDIVRVSIMSRMRLDADTVTIQHLPADIVRISVPVVETP